jgi:hypothetical protein
MIPVLDAAMCANQLVYHQPCNAHNMGPGCLYPNLELLLDSYTTQACWCWSLGAVSGSWPLGAHSFGCPQLPWPWHVLVPLLEWLDCNSSNSAASWEHWVALETASFAHSYGCQQRLTRKQSTTSCMVQRLLQRLCGVVTCYLRVTYACV